MLSCLIQSPAPLQQQISMPSCNSVTRKDVYFLFMRFYLSVATDPRARRDESTFNIISSAMWPSPVTCWRQNASLFALSKSLFPKQSRPAKVRVQRLTSGTNDAKCHSNYSRQFNSLKPAGKLETGGFWLDEFTNYSHAKRASMGKKIIVGSCQNLAHFFFFGPFSVTDDNCVHE